MRYTTVAQQQKIINNTQAIVNKVNAKKNKDKRHRNRQNLWRNKQEKLKCSRNLQYGVNAIPKTYSQISPTN